LKSSKSCAQSAIRAVDEALAALTNGAAGEWQPAGAAVDAARAKATVGEMSDAMEKVFGRHRAEIAAISGVYGARLAR
jgi:methylmalonyl-CoA mutase